jgi:hypothetical protein
MIVILHASVEIMRIPCPIRIFVRLACGVRINLIDRTSPHSGGFAMRFALAAVLALVIGSQADAQLIRRFGRAYTPGYGQYYYSSPTYYSAPYSSGVVTAGYYSPNTWSNNYVYPSSGYYYSSPTVGWNASYGYGNYSYGNRYYGGWGRRGWRW